MRRGIVRAAAAAGVALALLAGCGGSPADPPTTPPASPPTSPSPSPTPSPTPDAAVPPERPDMNRVDTETAEAVAVYFLQLYPYVYATGDLAEWRALSHPECVFCASVITNVEEMVAEGEHWEGGLPIFASVEATAVSDDFYSVFADLTEEAAQRLTNDGVAIEESTGGRVLATLALVFDGERWSVREGQIDEPAS